jgi:putative GTP pyrophosphokinase
MEEEFREQYVKDRPQLEAWGSFVCSYICAELESVLAGSSNCELFLKIPPTPRLKKEKSILDKAFRRNKNYSDPYAEITDKVGVRFVVLLIKDILVVTNIIESAPHWIASKDRDFQVEREHNPLIFDYQSEHYIVRAAAAQSYNGVQIAEGTPCEVQVRTLLQHAYSEMAHDSVYKPTIRTDPAILRKIARSMALIETTDDVFSDVSEVLSNRAAQLSRYEKSLIDLYVKLIGSEPFPDHAFTAQVVEVFSEEVEGTDLTSLEDFFKNHTGLIDIIAGFNGQSFVYSQPTVLFLYYLISKSHHRFRARWPGAEQDIFPLFRDLGISVS